MENVSAITLTDNTMHTSMRSHRISSTDLVSHETAHQWFGDLLTCRSWSQAWLNEGFATYFEALYGEHAFGEDHFNYEMYHDHQQVIAADNIQHKPTVYNRYYDAVDLLDPIFTSAALRSFTCFGESSGSNCSSSQFNITFTNISTIMSIHMILRMRFKKRQGKPQMVLR